LCYIGFILVYVLSGNAQALPFALPAWLTSLPAPAGMLFPSGAALTLLATTVYHAGVVMAQVGNVFACRSESRHASRLDFSGHRILWLGLAVEIVAILLMIYWPPAARALEHYPLPPHFWALLATYPFILYTADWVNKRIIPRRKSLQAITPQGDER
jgi:magnesium-transporting ATPase (P-type)